jgi:uncharacterized caspase-like protein
MSFQELMALRGSPIVALTLLVVLLCSAPALAEKRVALVIGNSAYQNVNMLPNPAKDAAAVGDMLTKAGFDIVISKQDVTNADMRRMVRDFSDKVGDADIAVVYYAGHGIEIDGTNYLLPIDTKLERDTDVEDEAVSLDRIVRILDPAKKLRLVILDACRDNPFQKTMKRSLSSRGIERGLAKVEPQNPNTLIAYAAKAGSTASDGVGDHSPFTTALLKQLPTPGQDLRKSLGYVRDDVLKVTSNAQEPFVYGSLGGDDVILVPGVPRPGAANVPAQVTALDPNSPLRQDYELAAQINTAAAWDAFLANYPKGFYADLARAARVKLAASETQPAPGGRNVASLNSTSQPSAPTIPVLNSADSCAGYAKLAVAQYNENRSIPNCFKGDNGAWHADYAKHYSWCLTAAPTATFAETSRRVAALQRCRSNAMIEASLPPPSSYSNGTDQTVQFGGPPFCKYTVTLKNPTIDIAGTKPGTAQSVKLSIVMIENTIPPCAYPPLGTLQHTYTGSGLIDSNGTVSLAFTPAESNRPQATAAFDGKLVAGKLIGTLTVQRIETRANLAWKVVSQFR